jgi:GDP-D-mannose dehydratase
MVCAPADHALAEDDPLIPRSPYALSELAQEMEGVRAIGDGLGVTIARAFNHMGPRQDPHFAASGFARRIADIEAGRWEPEIAVGNLDAQRDLTDVRDTIRAYTSILERGIPGRPYNVCSGRAITIREVLDRLLARARVPVRIRVDQARLRPNDVPLMLGNPARIQTSSVGVGHSAGSDALTICSTTGGRAPGLDSGRLRPTGWRRYSECHCLTSAAPAHHADDRADGQNGWDSRPDGRRPPG